MEEGPSMVTKGIYIRRTLGWRGSAGDAGGSGRGGGRRWSGRDGNRSFSQSSPVCDGSAGAATDTLSILKRRIGSKWSIYGFPSFPNTTPLGSFFGALLVVATFFPVDSFDSYPSFSVFLTCSAKYLSMVLTT